MVSARTRAGVPAWSTPRATRTPSSERAWSPRSPPRRCEAARLWESGGSRPRARWTRSPACPTTAASRACSPASWPAPSAPAPASPCAVRRHRRAGAAYNEQHGHAEGDRVLRLAAECFARGVRSYDCVCRLGGDEFALVLPGMSAESAATLVSRLAATFAAQAAPGTTMTVSGGVASFPQHAGTPGRAGAGWRGAALRRRARRGRRPHRRLRRRRGRRTAPQPDATASALRAARGQRGLPRADQRVRRPAGRRARPRRRSRRAAAVSAALAVRHRRTAAEGAGPGRRRRAGRARPPSGSSPGSRPAARPAAGDARSCTWRSAFVEAGGHVLAGRRGPGAGRAVRGRRASSTADCVRGARAAAGRRRRAAASSAAGGRCVRRRASIAAVGRSVGAWPALPRHGRRRRLRAAGRAGVALRRRNRSKNATAPITQMHARHPDVHPLAEEDVGRVDPQRLDRRSGPGCTGRRRARTPCPRAPGSSSGG